MSWSTPELRVRLAPLNRFKASSKIFYWLLQGGTSFVDLLCFCSVLCCYVFVRLCLYVLCGHLLGKGWPLGSRLWCLLWVCHFPISILGQVWYLIVSIPDICILTYFNKSHAAQWLIQSAELRDHWYQAYGRFTPPGYLVPPYPTYVKVTINFKHYLQKNCYNEANPAVKHLGAVFEQCLSGANMVTSIIQKAKADWRFFFI